MEKIILNKNKLGKSDTMNYLLVRKIGPDCQYTGCQCKAEYSFNMKYTYNLDSEFIETELPVKTCKKHLLFYLNDHNLHGRVIVDESDRSIIHYSKDWYPKVNTNFAIRLQGSKIRVSIPWSGTTNKEAKKTIRERKAAQSISRLATLLGIFASEGLEAAQNYFDNAVKRDLD